MTKNLLSTTSLRLVLQELKVEKNLVQFPFLYFSHKVRADFYKYMYVLHHVKIIVQKMH